MLYNVWQWKVVFFFSSLISKINSNPDKSSSQLHNLSTYPPHWVVWSRLEDGYERREGSVGDKSESSEEDNPPLYKGRFGCELLRVTKEKIKN